MFSTSLRHLQLDPGKEPDAAVSETHDATDGYPPSFPVFNKAISFDVTADPPASGAGINEMESKKKWNGDHQSAIIFGNFY